MKHEKYEVPPLGKYYAQRSYAKYWYNQEDAPQEIWDTLGEDNERVDYHKCLTIQDRNKIFDEGYMENERGWSIFPDGSGTCAGIMQFPNATPEMMYWWFSWFPKEDFRGRIWEPKNHIGNMITRKEFDAFNDTSVPLSQRTWGRHFFPLDLGVRPNPNAEEAPVRIQFYSPAEFGLDLERIRELGDDVSVICAQVGAIGMPQMTSFIHVCRKTETGMELRSRFWYGWIFKDGEPVRSEVRLPEPMIINQCKSQNIHLIEEYYNLSRILPSIYEENKDIIDRYEDCI